MPLANIETDFMGCLLNRQQGDDDFISQLAPVQQLAPAEQLAIYRGNLNGAHENVLQQVYPAIYRILGEDYFNQLARLYRFEYPSVEPDLNLYGHAFAEFLEKQIALHNELEDFIYLPDLARHEWFWHSCYFAENNSAFDFEQFTKIEETEYDRLVFITSPSLSIHKTDYPVIELWQANRHKVEDEQVFTMPEASVYYCIYRSDYQPEYAIIEPQHYQLLNAIIHGNSLAQLTADYNELLQDTLLHYIEQQWITGYRLTG